MNKSSIQFKMTEYMQAAKTKKLQKCYS